MHPTNQHKKRNQYKITRIAGFTLVELLVVIGVMAIILSILALTLVGQQENNRDTTRNTKATVLSEALEKYYDKNGEYPSVPSLAGQTTASVSQKLSITDKDLLIFPGASSSTQASIVSPSTTPSPKALVYAGTADGAANTQCQNDANGYCAKYQLRYQKEGTDEVVTIDSRRNPYLKNEALCSGAACIGAPSKPSIAGVQLNSSQVRFTASGATCINGTVKYQIRYNTTTSSESSMPSWPATWDSTTTRDVSISGSTVFYSQSRAQCFDGTDGGPVSASSDIHTLNLASGPAAPSPSASATSSSTITITWPDVTGATSYSVSGSGNASSCTSSPCYVSGLAASTYYTFSVYAINTNGSSAPGTANATTNPGGTPCYPPSTPSISASTSSTSSIYVSWGNSTGSTPITYYVYYGTNSSASTLYTTTSSTAVTVSGLSASTTYYFKVYASNCGTSSYSNTASATTSANPPTGTPPSTPSVSVTALSAVSVQVSWGASSGTTPISYSASGPGLGSCTSSPCTATGLSPNTSYSYSVTASNTYGNRTGSGSGSTQNTALAVSANQTDIAGRNIISYSYTNGYSPGGSNYSVSGGSYVSGPFATYSWMVRSNCTVPGNYTVTGPDGRQGSTSTDTQSTPSNAPNGLRVTGGPYSNGAVIDWYSLANASYYSSNRTGGGNPSYIANLQPPLNLNGALASNTNYNVAVRGANCAGYGPASYVAFTTKP